MTKPSLFRRQQVILRSLKNVEELSHGSPTELMTIEQGALATRDMLAGILFSRTVSACQDGGHISPVKMEKIRLAQSSLIDGLARSINYDGELYRRVTENMRTGQHQGEVPKEVAVLGLCFVNLIAHAMKKEILAKIVQN